MLFVKTTKELNNLTKMFCCEEYELLWDIVNCLPQEFIGNKLYDHFIKMKNAKEVLMVGQQVFNIENCCVVIWMGTHWVGVR